MTRTAGKSARSTPPWPESSNVLAHEILQSALNGMTTKLIEDFQAGGLKADGFVELGMKKATEYISFFKGLDDRALLSTHVYMFPTISPRR